MDEAILLMRWKDEKGAVHLGVCAGTGKAVSPVDPDMASWETVLQRCRESGESMTNWARRWMAEHAAVEVDPAQWIVPVEVTEVWAAGVTYELSRDAREKETTSAQSLYAKVYEATRPELFWKGLGSQAAGPFEPIGLRPDATWHVPEPELTVVLDDQGAIWGYTIGNDMTARDLEADNPLYLPQAKLFYRSAALGPAMVLADTVDPYALTITCEIWRHEMRIWQAEVTTAHMRRRTDELVAWLGRAWPIAPFSAVMTGAGLVPPDDVALEDGDEVRIEILPIGVLVNHARRIEPSWVAVVKPPQRVVRIDPRDTVAVSLGSLEPGHWINEYNVTVRDPIPFGHKVALVPMAVGDAVVKYGEQIGVASRPIAAGDHVHTHNVESVRGRGDLSVEGSEQS
ncbi:MAG: fumarylacetoacetate hydrolase [Sulfobacillus acidophilus]|uniref:Fumarylacetoacetate hydrolase n=1 Tax=Sulfobacillus acidophilus TaxID=53633 RepID=A0A2T2WJV8_9FIRM|nr:MAG: fumarylacetoacetate hydrolase [Sulfobacillus acidophilus]